METVNLQKVVLMISLQFDHKFTNLVLAEHPIARQNPQTHLKTHKAVLEISQNQEGMTKIRLQPCIPRRFRFPMNLNFES